MIFFYALTTKRRIKSHPYTILKFSINIEFLLKYYLNTNLSFDSLKYKLKKILISNHNSNVHNQTQTQVTTSTQVITQTQLKIFTQECLTQKCKEQPHSS